MAISGLFSLIIRNNITFQYIDSSHGIKYLIDRFLMEFRISELSKFRDQWNFLIDV